MPTADEPTAPSSRFGRHARTALSALLIAASFPPWDLGFLIWVALVPWLSGLERVGSYRQALAQGFGLSFGVGLLVAHWVAYAAHEFLQLPWVLGALVLGLFAATSAVPHLLLFAPLVHWARRYRPPGPAASLLLCLALAFAYTGLEWLVPRLFDVGLGYALHDATRLRQLADLGGVALLGFLVVLVNLLLWQIQARFASGEGPRSELALHAALILLIWLAAFAYGFERVRESDAALRASPRTLRVGVVQGNIANDVRLAWARGDERAAEKQLSAYMLRTEELVAQTPPIDLVVWPEASFPGVFQQPGTTLQRGRATKFDRQVLRLRRPIVFGAYDMTTAPGADGAAGDAVATPARTLYNSLFAVTPDYARPGGQGFVQRYHKHLLLPFAETLPGLSRSDWLKRLLPSLGFFGSGAGAAVFEITTPAGTKVGLTPFICSEALSAQHVIEGVRLGGEILLNVGSDGWFGPYGEPQFHLAISRMRSVETRRPQIRATNTGISALIRPGGEIVERSELGEAASLSLDVHVDAAGDTLMLRWGDWFGRVALAWGLVLLLVLRLLARSRDAADTAG